MKMNLPNHVVNFKNTKNNDTNLLLSSILHIFQAFPFLLEQNNRKISVKTGST